MLKTLAAVAAMLKEQKAALEAESDNRFKRDEETINRIKEEAVAFQEPMMAMIQNLDIAIKQLEGTQEVTHGQG